MTSPTLPNGQKDAGKTEAETDGVATPPVAVQNGAEANTPPLVAWWRVFKLVNLLMKQGCWMVLCLWELRHTKDAILSYEI